MLPSKLLSYFPDYLSSQILHFPSLESLHGFLSPTVPFPSLHTGYPFRRPSSSLTTVSLGRNLPQFPVPLCLVFTSHLNYRCWHMSCPISKDEKTWLSVTISPGAPGFLHIVDNKSAIHLSYVPYNLMHGEELFPFKEWGNWEYSDEMMSHTKLMIDLQAASLLSSNMA